MSLDELLSKNADKLKSGPRILTEPENISKGQFNYLMGLSRDYLPDGHSKAYSQRDLMFDILLAYRNVYGTRVMLNFRELTMKEAAKMIDWLKQETGK